MVIHSVAPLVAVPLKAVLLGPIFETIGLMLSKINCAGKVKTAKRSVQEI